MASTALLAGALLVPTAARPQPQHGGPKPPAGLRIVDSSSTTLTLGWEARRAGVAFGFELYRDGTRVGSTSRREFTFTGLSCGMAYTLSIEALEPAGRRSEPASIIAPSDPCPAPATPPMVIPRASPPASPPQDAETPAVRPPAHVPSVAPDLETLPQSGKGPAAFSWAGAGAFVWHENDVAPESLGVQLRANGFSWVAVLVHDGMDPDPIVGDWVRRFREASGLPVGGWGVLRTEPEREAELAHRSLEDNALDFYIANPEAEYKFSGDDGTSAERYGRSERFVRSFRQLEPDLPAAISSYCRADTQDIDWEAWNGSGFAFLPQAYVNDFGEAASPASCADAAADFFPAQAVHPTVGVYAGREGEPSPERYAQLLDEAGTVGFSVYLAETRMHLEQWRTFGDAIAELAIARRAGDVMPTESGVPAPRTRTEAS